MVDFPFELETFVDFEVKFMVVNFVAKLHTVSFYYSLGYFFVLFCSRTSKIPSLGVFDK